MVPGQNPFAMQKAVLENRVKSRGGWLMYAAGFSVVNTVLEVTGTNWRFMVGLGSSELLMGIGEALGGGSRILGFFLSLLPAAMFAFFGMQAMRGRLWAFYVGMALYALDGILILLFRDYLSAAFHAYVIYRMFEGLSAARQLKDLEAAAASQMRLAQAPGQQGAWPPPPAQPAPAAAFPPPAYGQQPAPYRGPQSGQPQAPVDWANQPGGPSQPQQPGNLDGS